MSLDKGNSPAALIRPTSTIFIANNLTDFTPFDGIVMCSDASADTYTSMKDVKAKGNILVLSCGIGKLGSRALRSQLPRAPPFIASLSKRGTNPRILFTCSTGTDLSAGVALAVLCLYFDENGKLIAVTIRELIWILIPWT